MKELIQDSRLLKLGVPHGVTARAHGDMAVGKNMDKLFKELGIPGKQISHLKQVHGNKIIYLSSCSSPLVPVHRSLGEGGGAGEGGGLPEADAFLLTAKGSGCAVYTADCVPVFVWDKSGKIIGLAHCGWRGIVKQLPLSLARRVASAAKQTAGMSAFIGPHIKKCCFTVDADVAEQFNPSSVLQLFMRKPDGGAKIACGEFEEKFHVDLSEEITNQLIEAGIKRKDITASRECTCCSKEAGGKFKFFSYRRDKRVNRMLSFVYMP